VVIRIISRFKDYYDVVAGQGVDLTRVFTRNTTEFKGNFPLPEWDEKRSWRLESNVLYPRISEKAYHEGRGRYSTQTYDIEYLYVLFAGKLYGGIALKDMRTGPTFGDFSYYWDADSWLAKAAEIGYTGDNKAYYGKNKSTEMDEILRLLTVKGDEVLSDWAIENKLSIAIACGFFHTRERGDWFVVDPNLKELNFQKVLDPFTAYQELEQWIGGVLGNTEVIPEMADKDKIAAHGFNSWSFRKHKLDNK
jgi:hypothetical protein